VPNRTKTETSSRIPLLKPALDIIEKYEEHPLCENEGIGLPVLSNQKINSYLKAIAKDCKYHPKLDIPFSSTYFCNNSNLN
jgi:hypothetical protein